MIRRFLWGIADWLYAHVAKPILFRIPPDAVHSGMTRITVVVARVGVLRGFFRWIFVRPRDERIEQTFHGLKFTNPVGLAAGFDKDGEVIPVIAALGFGFGEVGSVTAKPCPGNPRPWFYRLPKSKAAVINAGLGNAGAKVILKRLRQYPARSLRDFPVVLSVAKTNTKNCVTEAEGIKDYVATVKQAKNESAIQIIELNISCPNAYGGEPFTTVRSLDRLLKEIDKLGVTQPIYIKMPIDLSWKAFSKLLDVIIKHRVAGVTISNLAKDRTQVDPRDVLPDTILGNLSGKPTWSGSNELIRQTYLKYGDKLTIIGLGGIFTAEDAYTKIRLGASLVQIITGMLFNGPQLAAEISYDLSKLLERDGYTHISQAIGIDSKK